MAAASEHLLPVSSLGSSLTAPSQEDLALERQPLIVPTPEFVDAQQLGNIVLPKMCNGQSFSRSVFRRSLQLIDRCKDSVFVVITPREPLGGVRDGVVLKPEIQAAWEEGQFTVFDELPDAALDLWGRAGAVLISASSGLVRQVSAMVDTKPEASIWVDGGVCSQLCFALARSNEHCLAIRKKVEHVGGVSDSNTQCTDVFPPEKARTLRYFRCEGPLGVQLDLATMPTPLSASRKRSDSFEMEVFQKFRRKSLPLENMLPASVAPAVYRAILDLTLQYAEAGIEGVKKGHTVVLGCVDGDLEALGTINGLNDFRQPEIHNLTILNETGQESLRRRMNMDGMTLIDGATGVPCFNNFFVSQLSDCESGGARKKSALSIVEHSKKGALAIVVSSDSCGSVMIVCRAGPETNIKMQEHSSLRRAT